MTKKNVPNAIKKKMKSSNVLINTSIPFNYKVPSVFIETEADIKEYSYYIDSAHFSNWSCFLWLSLDKNYNIY